MKGCKACSGDPPLQGVDVEKATGMDKMLRGYSFLVLVGEENGSEWEMLTSIDLALLSCFFLALHMTE